MRNYTYHSRIVTELYTEGALSRCVIVTLHYDGSMVNHIMWITKKMFEEAMDGDQDIQLAIDNAYTDLLQKGILKGVN